MHLLYRLKSYGIIAITLFLIRPVSYGQRHETQISVNFFHKQVAKAIRIVAQEAHLELFISDTIGTIDKAVTFSMKNVTADAVMQFICRGLDVRYEFTDSSLTVYLINHAAAPPGDSSGTVTPVVQGRVTEVNGAPICRASIKVTGTAQTTITNDGGYFELHNMPASYTLVVSSVSHYEKTIPFGNSKKINIVLIRKYDNLALIVTPYSSVSLKQNTGNIFKIPKDPIHASVAASVADLLYAQAPGLLVQQSNGNAGSRYRMQLDGPNSFNPGAGRANLPDASPLFIIDGIPLCTGNVPINLLKWAGGDPTLSGIAQGGFDALAFLNTLDIEEMYLLTDADATAIYGSRGANGVVVINTRHGKKSKAGFSMDISSGFGNIINTTPLMNTSQYLTARREAFRNDGVIPTAQNAPDIMLWGSDHYTDFRKLLVGGTSFVNRAHLSFSGAEGSTSWYLGGGIRRETSVFSRDLYFIQRSFDASFSTKSKNKKFGIDLNLNSSLNTSNSISSDLMPGTRLSPNIPALTDNAGHYIRSYKGVSIPNPLLWLLNRYTDDVSTVIASLGLRDTITKGLVIKLTLGGNRIESSETSIFPIASLDSAAPRLGTSYFATNAFYSWIAEPQANYRFSIKKLCITMMTGASFQQVRNNRDIIEATGYTTDDLLLSQAAAPHLVSANNPVLYKYAAAFGSLNVAWDSSLFINFTGRRDGSSRFGPDKRMANFGAIGANWIIRNFTSCNDSLRFISFLRIRGSFGTTGNDQIGDYAYLDSWRVLTPNRAYDGLTGLVRDGIPNSYFGWEKTQKWNFSVNLDLLKKLKLEAGWHCNRSTNLLISDVLPAQTGFSQQDNKNSPAIIQNTGTYFIVSMDSIKVKKVINVSFRFQLNIPVNKLVSFPSLAASSYSGSLVVGKSITGQRTLVALGVDPRTGLMIFKDINGDGQITTADYVNSGNIDVKYYESLFCTVRWQQLQLGLGLEGRKQPGLNPIYANVSPDKTSDLYLGNQTTDMLARWQKSGDITSIQRFTTGASTPSGIQAANAFNNSRTSSLLFTDASFIRLKTINLSVSLPENWAKKMHLEECRFYAEAQNMLTLTHYRGTDPVAQDFNSIPPLKTITCGIHIII